VGVAILGSSIEKKDGVKGRWGDRETTRMRFLLPTGEQNDPGFSKLVKTPILLYYW
jgi:hypothetical protein